MAPGTADKKNNVLPLWGNEKTMNLNNLILTNILSSHYFKVNLYQLKTYHEVIDEIYYHVNHLEPWEKGSRKTSGQTGMCGGVRGVGAGGIVSTAFCILYKLFTLKLTRKQVNGLITHCDSPYIRALGFMYIRFTQPPTDLWDWFDPYLDDKEELDVKAGGGQVMTIGEILRHFLTKLEWFSTLFPRIPVPIQKEIERKLSERKPSSLKATSVLAAGGSGDDHDAFDTDEMVPLSHHGENNDHVDDKGYHHHERNSRHRRSPTKDGRRSDGRTSDLADEIARERDRQRRERDRVSRSPHRHHRRSSSRHRDRRSRSRDHHSRHRDRSREHRDYDKDRSLHREKERRRSRSRSRDRHHGRNYSGDRRSRERHHH